MSICSKCGKDVTPNLEGKCPKCGSDKFTVSNTFTIKYKIEDGISKYDKQIQRLKKFQEIYKGTKVEKNLEIEIQKLKNVIKDLEKLLPEKPDKEILLTDEAKFSDKVIVGKPETKKKTFTADVILIEEANSKIEEGDKVVERSNGEIFDKIEELRIENRVLHNSNSRLSKLGIIGTIGGGVIGLIVSYLITISTQPQIIVVNATSGTIIP